MGNKTLFIPFRIRLTLSKEGVESCWKPMKALASKSKPHSPVELSGKLKRTFPIWQFPPWTKRNSDKLPTTEGIPDPGAQTCANPGAITAAFAAESGRESANAPIAEAKK